MELEFSKVSPGGNLTILIWDKVPRGQHSSIANILMDSVTHLGAEQVGYVEKSDDPQALAHLQMMGGEFCGNATRALAFMLVQRNTSGITVKDNTAQFYLTVSGVSKPLLAEVKCDKDGFPLEAKVEMPIYQELSSVESKVINSDGSAYIVRLEGITHIIVDEDTFPFDQNNYQNQLASLRDMFNLQKDSAVGVMWRKNDKPTDNISMKPVVWVRDTNSYYYETSCGSGTLALALANAKDNITPFQKYEIKQPSNSYITATVIREEECFIQAYIGGSVKLIASGTVNI